MDPDMHFDEIPFSTINLVWLAGLRPTNGRDENVSKINSMRTEICLGTAAHVHANSIKSKHTVGVCGCVCLRHFVQKDGDENRLLVFFFSRRYYRKGKTYRMKRFKNRWPHVCILHTNNAAENPIPNENVSLSHFEWIYICIYIWCHWIAFVSVRERGLCALYVQTMSCRMHTTGIRRTISAVGMRSISFYRVSSFFSSSSSKTDGKL